MTSKERIAKVLSHQEPDRVPIGEVGIDSDTVSTFLGRETYYRGGIKTTLAIWDGKEDEVKQGTIRDMIDFYGNLEYDLIPVFHLGAERIYPKKEWSKIDEFNYECEGKKFIYSKETNALMAEPQADNSGGFPDPDKIKEIEIPDYKPLEESGYALFKAMQEELPDRFLVARSVKGFFPVAMDQAAWLMAYALHPEECHRILDKTCENEIKRAEEFIAHGADAVFIGGDYCNKTGPMMSPEMFDEFVKPYLKRLCDAIHTAGGYAMKHTDGNTWKLISKLEEAGVDILQAIEIGCGMDMGELKEKHGQNLTFLGGVDCDNLVRGSKEEVKEQVLDTIKRAGQGGGLIVGSGNSVQYGTPYENYITMFETVKEAGVYPLEG
ncbi:MAG: uroporphyrinogen decarboxylase family protein [Planctomycetota bacterium]|jgi:uroporphyrinogen decarboxylase